MNINLVVAVLFFCKGSIHSEVVAGFYIVDIRGELDRLVLYLAKWAGCIEKQQDNQ